MPTNLKSRHFLSLRDFSPEEINYLLELCRDLKEKKRSGIRGDLLEGRNIVLIFEKSSTRTRCSFQVAAYDEGARVTFLTNSQMGKKESIEDSAKVLGRLYDGIGFRGYQQSTVDALARHAGIPVWNGLTDLYHPTQILADLMTIREKVAKPLSKIKLVYAGDARNNMGNSLMIGAAQTGMNFCALAPRSLMPDESLVTEMRRICRSTGGSIELSQDTGSAVRGADVIYTDVWVSMGEEKLFAERIALLEPYRVDMNMIEATGNPDVIFLHCLPAFHDLETETAVKIHREFGISEMEVSDQVFRSRHSVVFDQAENRMHSIKAVMVATIGLDFSPVN